MGLMEKIFGDLNAKEVKKIEKIVEKVEALDETMQAKSDDELRAMTPHLKEWLAQGETLDDIEKEREREKRKSQKTLLMFVSVLSGAMLLFCAVMLILECIRL